MQMHVFGHDHVSVDAQDEAAVHPLQNLDEEVVARGRIEPSPPMLTSERHEVRLRGLLKTLQTMRHGEQYEDLFPVCSYR
jgi:hypothetical protein